MKRKRDFTWDTGWGLTRFGRFVRHFTGKMPYAADWGGETAQPPMDIFEDGSGIHVQLEVPGMGPQDLAIRLDRNRLCIEGVKRSRDRDCLRYICLEREYGAFRRMVDLPVSVDASGVRAALTDGVLRVWLPKVTEKRRSVVNVPIEG